MKNVFLLSMFLIVLIACAVPQKTLNNNIGQDSAEYKLEEARITLSTGNFQGAADMYLNICNDTTIVSEIRETALFNLGMMYSDEAQNVENYETALKYLRQLTADFPKTQYKEKINREIRYIKNQIKRLKRK